MLQSNTAYKTFIWHAMAAITNISLFVIFLSFPTFEFQGVWKKLTFFTNYNQMNVSIFYGCILVADLVCIMNNKSTNKYSVSINASHQLLLLISGIVAFAFWIIYVINPHLLLSKRALEVIPFSFLFMFHGGNFLCLLIDYFWISRARKQAHRPYSWYAMGGSYIVIVLLNYWQYERFPYPIQKHISLEGNLAILMIFFALVHLGYRRFHDQLAKPAEIKID